MRFSALMRLGFGLFFGLMLSTCYAAAGTTTNNTYSDPAKNIMVTKANPQFMIVLASNPTTGYSWHILKYDKHLLTLVNHEYQRPKSKLIGAGGKEAWTFRVNDIGFKAPQISKIDLLYARPWNLQDNSTPVEFTVVTH